MAKHARLERAMSEGPVVARIGDGMYRVVVNGRAHVAYVAGSGAEVWLHWNGQVFHRPFDDETTRRLPRGATSGHQSLSAPMPATVLKVNVAAGSGVHQGDTLVILEAMKMELPIRSAGEAVVKAVHCREGELVQPGTVLVELE
jgi:3-methylcrotonyl-CoA carboxylase alpha subunit